MKNILSILMVAFAICCNAQDFSDDNRDVASYLSFVAPKKQWRFVSSGPWHGQASLISYYFSNEEVEFDGKHYLPFCASDLQEPLGFMRNDGRKVYLYLTENDVNAGAPGLNTDILLMDFSLEQGDLFKMASSVVEYIVEDGSAVDGARDYVVTRVGTTEINGHNLRTIYYAPVDEPNAESHWTEYITLPQLDLRTGVLIKQNAYISGCDIYDYYYFPYTFDNSLTGCHGQRIKYGPEMAWDPNIDYDNLLNFEIEDGKLHVSGYMNLNCGGNSYVFCFDVPGQGDGKQHLRIEKEDVEPLATCGSFREVDFTFEGLDPTLDYVIEYGGLLYAPATSVNGISVENAAARTAYDMTGRSVDVRVARQAGGLYIVNGKKVLYK